MYVCMCVCRLVSFLKHMSVTSPLLHSSCNRSRLCQMISSDWFYYLADGGSDVGSDSDSDGETSMMQ